MKNWTIFWDTFYHGWKIGKCNDGTDIDFEIKLGYLNICRFREE